MAKILFTAFMADMRGKVNGTVFSKNAVCAYARTKVSPANPQSPDQSIVRQRLASLSAQWRGLTQSQRNSWIEGSVNFPRTNQFGQTYYLTGQQLYIALNTNILTVQGAEIVNCPAPVEVPEFSLQSGAADVSAQTISVTSIAEVPTNFKLVLQATTGLSAGVQFVKNQYRQVTTMNSGSTGTMVFQGAYFDKFPPIVLNTVIGARAYLVNTLTGQAGVPTDVLIRPVA